jgi:FkbM family methyltransferase
VSPQLRTGARGRALAATRTRKLVVMAADARYRKLAPRWFATGVFPSLEHASVPFRREFRTVFDVGASRGQFGLFALARFPGAKIIGFEPLPQARAIAVRALGGSRAEVHEIALGASARDATLHVSRADDSSSLLAIGRRQTTAFPGTEAVGALGVRVELLSSYLDHHVERPVLLKIDAQGGELDVLIGAGDALGLVDELLVEASFLELYDGQARASQVVAHALAHGLHLVDISGLARSAGGEALQADFLFSRDRG